MESSRLRRSSGGREALWTWPPPAPASQPLFIGQRPTRVEFNSFWSTPRPQKINSAIRSKLSVIEYQGRSYFCYPSPAQVCHQPSSDPSVPGRTKKELACTVQVRCPALFTGVPGQDPFPPIAVKAALKPTAVHLTLAAFFR